MPQLNGQSSPESKQHWGSFPVGALRAAVLLLTAACLLLVPTPAQAGSRAYGKACSNNNQCRDNLCDLAPGNPRRCIPANGRGRKGQYCSHNNQCQPGVMCRASSCGGRPKSLGNSCIRNADCSSNRCDQARGNASKCIPNDGTGRKGAYCSHNNQCQRGILCDLRSHKCGGAQKQVGAACRNNTECLSAHCDSARGNPKKCVPSRGSGHRGQYCSHNNQCRPGVLCRNRECGGRASPLKSRCSSNQDCASNRCDIGWGTTKTGLCIPNDGTGRLGQFCTHNNHCSPGKLYCISRKCSTPVRTGGACSNSSVCASGCCQNARCSARNSCYKAEDALCDIMTGGGCSIVKNSEAEIREAAATARRLQRKIAALKQKVATLPRRAQQSIAGVARDVGAEGRRVAGQSIRLGQQKLRTAQMMTRAKVQASTQTIAQFRAAGPKICPVKPGSQGHSQTLEQLEHAKDQMPTLVATASKAVNAELAAHRRLMTQVLRDAIGQHQRAAQTAMQGVLRQHKAGIDVALASVQAPMDAFIKDPIGTLTNPIGTAILSIEAKIDAANKGVSLIERELLRTLEQMRQEILKDMRGKTRTLFSSLDLLEQNRRHIENLATAIQRVAAHCNAQEQQALANLINTKIVPNPNVSVPLPHQLPARISQVSSLKRHLPIGMAKESAQVRRELSQVQQKLMQFRRRQRDSQSRARAMGSSLKAELDQSFAGKTPAQQQQARRALMARLRQSYGKHPRLFRRLQQRVDQEIARRKHGAAKPPTGHATTRRPTTRPPTRRPTTRPPTRRPTTRPPTRRPTTRPPTRRPTTRPPTRRPTTRPNRPPPP